MAPPAQANAAGTSLVISEVYGGGGSSSASAAFKTDFIELYNPTGSALSMNGMSLQYRSGTYSSGGSVSVAALPDTTVAAGGHYLVSLSTAGTGGADLTGVDFTSTSLSMSGSGGQAILSSGTTGITATGTSMQTAPGVIDFVGYGTTPTSSETAPTGSATAVATSAQRQNEGTDTDNNLNDFATGTPTPLGSSSNSGPQALALTNPGNKAFAVDTAITPFSLSATGGGSPYTFSSTTLPTGLTLDASTGTISGTPTVNGTTSVTATVSDSADPAATASTTFSITVSAAGAVIPIATVQGTGSGSTYAGSGEKVTVRGIVTGVYDRGFASSGAQNCGFCGFYLQTAGSGGAVDETPGASDAVFVYGGGGFTGLDSAAATIARGDLVEVTGTVVEFQGLTEINADASNGSFTKLGSSLGTVTPTTTIPLAADREAHEGELFAPTDTVITDVYNFQTYGEFGLATGNRPLQQPAEICRDGDSACIAAAQQDIKDRGLFLDDGTSTAFLTSGTFYSPQNSNNSDIPYPYIDKTHSARVSAKVTFPQGGVLDFRNSKWYLQPPRPVLAAGHDASSPDLGTDVVTFEDTRADNAAPADVGGDLKLATYNVENYFTLTGEAFAAANPYYNCSYDYDRAGAPLLMYQCTSPTATPTAWDPVTGVPTAYTSGTISGPRGAVRQEDLDRQTAKIVTAINLLDADVVSLQEMSNPNKLRLGVTNSPLNPDPAKTDGGLGTTMAWRDESVSYLVDELNQAAGSEVWDYVFSPAESLNNTSVQGMCSTVNPNGTPVSPADENLAYLRGTCSWASSQDVIRSTFIYKVQSVVPVGPAVMDLPGSSAPVPSPFDNAREPFAQYFKPVGYPDSEGFLVIANHFKSKGDSDAPYGPATGGDANDPLHGAFNATRVEQAQELTRFANELAADYGTDAVFMLGDFNAYTGEDPVHAILEYADDALDFGLVEPDDPDDLSYVFTANVDGVGYGAAGSIDHVFASAGARAMISGADVWEINANEPGTYNYGRYNNNKTDFWDGDLPFGGSDHNPEIIGINLPPNPNPVTDVQIIGSNDFHGRLIGSSSDGGAAQLASGVNQLKDIYGEDNSIFVAAGDLIGASTFESFVANDKPTLDALNKAGLEVSAVGNHEFDRGYEDLINRVMKPYDATTNPYGADGGLNWDYLSSNVVYTADPDGTGPIQVDDPIVMPTSTKTVGGVQIGFVGAVTEDLMGLVSPGGMEGVGVDPIVSTVNGYADSLKAGGADLVVLLLHEGSPTTDCSTMQTTDSGFATILAGLDDNIDTVVSGHTHLKYACEFEVPGWAGRSVTTRPVVSAGQYGISLDQIVYSFDSSGEAVDVRVDTVAVKGDDGALFAFGEDPEVKAVVDDAIAAAAGPGAAVLGTIGGAFDRAKLADGATENRGGESTLGNLVAEIQRWATPDLPGVEPAQIAFMNPGGLRADLKGVGSTYPKEVTYKEAAAVQPFANTLVNMDLTGAQIKTVLEQQWQRDANGNIPSRPFLKLGTSSGFTYSYYQSDDPAHSGAKVGHVTGMWLDGVALSQDQTYSVTMNSFLAAGGDNFWEFANGADKRDTAKTDLQAQVEYMAAQASGTPLDVGFEQHGVGVTFPAAAPATYNEGDTVTFDLSSLDMTAPGSVKDSSLTISLDGQTLGTAPVDHATGSTPNDEYGTASVSVTLPSPMDTGTVTLLITGAATGTEIRVPVSVTGTGAPLTQDSTITAGDVTTKFGQNGSVTIAVDPATATGMVTVAVDGDEIGEFALSGGSVTVPLSGAGVKAGRHAITFRYAGDSVTNPSSGSATWTVAKRSVKLQVTLQPKQFKVGKKGTVIVKPGAATGKVQLKIGKKVYSAKIKKGKAVFTVAAFQKKGTYKATASLVSNNYKAPSKTVNIKVVKS
ncbi:MAG: ExeM/NucH family extracellular endonuclease [Nocardioides sp.]